jgi:hypothetical protein
MIPDPFFTNPDKVGTETPNKVALTRSGGMIAESDFEPSSKRMSHLPFSTPATGTRTVHAGTSRGSFSQPE